MKKLIYILILFLNIISCGGGEEGGGDRSGGTGKDYTSGNDGKENIPFVSYSTEYGTCLSTNNSEAFLNYSDAGGKNITLIWNCANYEDPYSKQFYDSHIKLLFSEYQDPDYGSCYQFSTSYISEGTCYTIATVPEEPLYQALIEDIYIGPKYGDEIPFSLTMRNTGNVTLLNIRTTVIFEGVFYADYGEYPYTERTLMQGADFHVGIDNSYDLSERGLAADDIGDMTYDVTVILSIGDGQVLDVHYLSYYPY
jgi:hypothetical protein